MRITEFKYPSTPRVYLDMDGTLADYFGELERHHGVKHWKDIGKDDVKIEKIASKPGFFANLKPLSNAGKLIAGVLNIAGDYSILSSPLMSHVDQSTEEKQEWIERYMHKRPPQETVFSENKFKWATQPDGTPNVLIDDYEPNIKLWEAHGGIGLIYTNESCENVLTRLQQVFNGELKPSGKIAQDIDEDAFEGPIPKGDGKLYTNKAVQEYVDKIHHDYQLNSPFSKHKAWILVDIPLSKLRSNEHIHQADPYYRRINIDFDHIGTLDPEELGTKPVVADADGFLLDGNHRANAAKMYGRNTIRAFIPYNHRL